jgi:hypothetical protein
MIPAAMVHEGIAEINRGINTLAPENNSERWANAQMVLGHALGQFAKLDRTTSHFESAISA